MSVNNKTEVWTVMDAAIECNNTGVEFLRKRRIDDALVNFKAAARIMHPVSQYFHYSRTKSSSSLSADLFASIEHSVEPAILAEKVETMMQNAKLELMASRPVSQQQQMTPIPSIDRLEENSFIMSEPLVVEKSEIEPASCTLESAIIVYNMGLVYRLSGNSSYLLYRSWSLFDMAFSLVFSIPNETRSARVGMVCLNNAGEIQHMLGNYHLCRQYMDALYSIVLCLPQPLDEDTFRERHQLLLNVMLLREPQIAGAA